MDDSLSLNIRQIFGSRLGHTSRQWRLAVDERLQPFGLTEATWLPLLYLARGKMPMRQKDLAETVGIESSTLVRLIDALDHAGLIERRIDGDRRARLLCLTPRGQALVEQVEEVAADVRQQILADISDEELAATLRVIERIYGALIHMRTADHGRAAETAEMP